MKRSIIMSTVALIFALSWNFALADFYVIPTGTRYKHPEVVSAYMSWNGSYQTIMTVPPGKTFILTDIVTDRECTMTIYENDVGNKKTRIVFYESVNSGPMKLSHQFGTGIPFYSQANINVQTGNSTGITITGYLIDN